MKKLFSLICLLVLAAGSAFAQKMVVRTADGKVVKYNVTKVTEVTFEEAEPVEWVDLGLPSGTLWATMNIGADTPEEMGETFRWGETEPYDGSGRETYKFYEIWNDGKTFITKYSSDPKNTEYVDYLTELEPEDDAATVNWGEDWQMPNKAQMEELLNSSYTIITYTTQNDIKGVLITSRKYGNSIFLPSQRNYWTREVNTQKDPEGRYTEYYYGAYWLFISWNNKIEITSSYRHTDRNVRPVRKN